MPDSPETNQGKTEIQLALEGGIKEKKAAQDPGYKGDNPKSPEQVKEDLERMGKVKGAPAVGGANSQIVNQKEKLSRLKEVTESAKKSGQAQWESKQWHFDEGFRSAAREEMGKELLARREAEKPREEMPKKKGQAAENPEVLQEQYLAAERHALMHPNDKTGRKTLNKIKKGMEKALGGGSGKSYVRGDRRKG